jgi:hypothetical protein
VRGSAALTSAARDPSLFSDPSHDPYLVFARSVVREGKRARLGRRPRPSASAGHDPCHDCSAPHEILTRGRSFPFLQLPGIKASHSSVFCGPVLSRILNSLAPVGREGKRARLGSLGGLGQHGLWPMTRAGLGRGPWPMSRPSPQPCAPSASTTHAAIALLWPMSRPMSLMGVMAHVTQRGSWPMTRAGMGRGPLEHVTTQP